MPPVGYKISKGKRQPVLKAFDLHLLRQVALCRHCAFQHHHLGVAGDQQRDDLGAVVGEGRDAVAKIVELNAVPQHTPRRRAGRAAQGALLAPNDDVDSVRRLVLVQRDLNIAALVVRLFEAGLTNATLPTSTLKCQDPRCL